MKQQAKFKPTKEQSSFEVSSKMKQTEIGMIPEDWKFEELEKHAKIIMGQSPESKYYNFNGKGTLFLQGIRTFGSLHPNYDTWTTKVTKLAKKCSILLSVRAPVGEVNVADKDVCIGRGLMSVDGKNNRFILYLFKGFKNYVVSKETGTVYGSVTRDDISKLKFPFPSDSEQSAIASILSDLDSKIELNQQMNNTLEAIGQAIFKHWFIDFEFPNEEGKPYKSSGGEMVESELGEIPKGWKVGKYSDLVDVTTGKGLKRNEFVENGEFSVIGANGELGKTDKFLFDEDLILTGRVGTLGTVYIIRNKVWVSDNVLISKAKYKEFFYYSYYTIRNFDLKSLNRGSTQPLITQTDLKNQTCLIPGKNLLVISNKVLLSLFDKIYEGENQNSSLSQIRDSLLPKLLSGKIRVPVKAKTYR